MQELPLLARASCLGYNGGLWGWSVWRQWLPLWRLLHYDRWLCSRFSSSAFAFWLSYLMSMAWSFVRRSLIKAKSSLFIAKNTQSVDDTDFVVLLLVLFMCGFEIKKRRQWPLLNVGGKFNSHAYIYILTRNNWRSKIACWCDAHDTSYVLDKTNFEVVFGGRNVL